MELRKLTQAVDSRYATDYELAQIEQFSSSFKTRVNLYHKLAQAEGLILMELYKQLHQSHPTLFIFNNQDVSQKCRYEVQVTFQYAVQSILWGESWLQENFLLWFQTIIRSLKLQPTCEVVYSRLEALLQGTLPPTESAIICPIICTIRKSLTEP